MPGDRRRPPVRADPSGRAEPSGRRGPAGQPSPDGGEPASQQQLDLSAPPRPATPARAEPRVYPVSQLVRLASRLVDDHFGAVAVEGEVSNLRRPASGHLYFTLKDARAQLPVVIFRTAAVRLRFRLEDGQRLCCRGRLTIYEQQGRFQLMAETAEPTGVGALQLAFEQLKRKLQAQGLFARERKRPLPRYPREVAVVTSRTGAALRDVLRVLQRRCPVRVVVCPTPVQGAAAAAEVAMAVRRADRVGADVLIVARGGGSLEDLWAFNEEQVARAIHAARTPVISGVGHETDVTIADLVADRRAPTPSAAAEIAVPARAELQQQLATLRQRLARRLGQRLAAERLELERALRRLGSPRALIDRSRLRLDDTVRQAHQALLAGLVRRRRALGALQLRLNAQQPQARLARDRATLEAQLARLQAATLARLQRSRATLAELATRLDALSPLAVLSRGYALARDASGRVVRDAEQVDPGESLDLRLHRGALRCRVVDRRPDDDRG